MTDSTAIYTEKSLEEMLNDYSIDSIMAINTDKAFIAWNRTAEKIHGKTKAEVIGKPFLEIIPSMQEDEETLQAINIALKGMKSFVPASRNYYHRLHAENHFIPLKESDGTIIGVMNIVHDVAHRIKAEEQLQYLNDELLLKNKELQSRNAELLSLSKVASNDLKEPLRKIYTAAEAIITNDARQLSNNGKAHLRRIQSSAQKMGLITDDLLSYTTITKEKNAEEYAMVELNAVLDEAKKRNQRFIEDKNAVIEAPGLPVINGNYNLLAQLFQNILNNSIKFQLKNNKPVIKVTAENIKKNNGNYLKVSFTDNGIGLQKEHTETIFNLFTRVSNSEEFRGSGMGLAVCKKIMEQHNGFIEAASPGENGTEISCYFPV